MADKQVVMFRLGSEHYAVDISVVKEIMDRSALTTVADAAAELAGVIDLRGQTVPVVDLRRRLGLAASADFTRILVLELETATIGGIVDGVDGVLTLNEGDIRPGSEVAGVHHDYVAGIAQLDADRLVLLLNVHQLLAADAAQLMQEAAHSSP